MTAKPKKKSRYYTYSHDINGCLNNGSYYRQDGKRIVQYMNGDYMGDVSFVPGTMTEVDAVRAKSLLPKGCK